MPTNVIYYGSELFWAHGLIKVSEKCLNKTKAESLIILLKANKPNQWAHELTNLKNPCAYLT